MTVLEMLRLPLEQRLEMFGTQNLSKIKIDELGIKGYKGFSFFWEKTYPVAPVRSQGGTIDLSSNSFFLTPHLKIDFSMISYDDYRKLNQLMLSKNEFNVTFYDTVFSKTITEKMYFAPDQLPKLYTMARTLNGEKWTEIIGIRDYTIELIGTNNTFNDINITYQLNKPADASWGYGTSVEFTTKSNVSVGIGNDAIIKTDGENVSVVRDITFGNKYQLQYWTEKKDGTGFKYIDGDEYLIRNSMTLYAQWKAGAK